MDSELQVGGGLLLLFLLVYVGGRLHQLARSTQERDEAYRDGYDDATRSLFHLAARVSQKIHAVPDPHTTRELPAVAKPPAFPPVVPGDPLPHRPAGEQRNQRRARHAA